MIENRRITPYVIGRGSAFQWIVQSRNEKRKVGRKNISFASIRIKGLFKIECFRNHISFTRSSFLHSNAIGIFLTHNRSIQNSFVIFSLRVEKEKESSFISSRTMHKLHLVPWAILVPFLSTGLAVPAGDLYQSSITDKTDSACVASSTKYDLLSFEFWIEAVFLEPVKVDGTVDWAPRVDNPLRLDRNYVPSDNSTDGTYSRVVVAQDFKARDLFFMNFGAIFDSNFRTAEAWPYMRKSGDNYPGWYPFAFDVESKSIRTHVDIPFRAVEVCSPTGELELELRARFDWDYNVEGRTFFQPFPFVCVLKRKES